MEALGRCLYDARGSVIGNKRAARRGKCVVFTALTCGLHSFLLTMVSMQTAARKSSVLAGVSLSLCGFGRVGMLRNPYATLQSIRCIHLGQSSNRLAGIHYTACGLSIRDTARAEGYDAKRFGSDRSCGNAFEATDRR